MGMSEQLEELITLSKLFLYRHYQAGAWKMVDQETFEYFRKLEKVNEQPVISKQAPKQNVQAAPAPKIPPKNKPQNRPQLSPAFSFELDPLNKSDAIPLGEMEKVISEQLPGVAFAKTVPTNKKPGLPHKGQAEVFVLVDPQDPPQHQRFLANLCKAIQLCLAPAIVVQRDQISEAMQEKWVVTSHALEGSQDQVIPLEEISQYLKDPAKKAALWEMLGKKIPPRKGER